MLLVEVENLTSILIISRHLPAKLTSDSPGRQVATFITRVAFNTPADLALIFGKRTTHSNLTHHFRACGFEHLTHSSSSYPDFVLVNQTWLVRSLSPFKVTSWTCLDRGKGRWFPTEPWLFRFDWIILGCWDTQNLRLTKFIISSWRHGSSFRCGPLILNRARAISILRLLPSPSISIGASRG